MKKPHVLRLNFAMTSSPSVFRSRVARSVCLTVPLALCIASYAQSPNSNAESAWANVQSLFEPVTVSKFNHGHAKPHDQVEAEIKQQAARAREAAQSAHDFYTAFPGHPKAAEARKIEALTALRGVEVANASLVQSALATAQAYRANSSFSADDRCEVALAMDRVDLSAKAKQGLATDTPQARRTLADNLRTEFGDLPALQDYYMEIARMADTPTAIDLANTVMQSRGTSQNAKARAQAILDRAALVGKKLNLQLTQLGGGEIDLGLARGKVTVIVAWRTAESEALMRLLQYRAGLDKADLIYLALGGSVDDATEARQFARLPGTYCYAPAGVAAKKASDGLKLQYAATPQVCVLNRTGLVIGSGSLSELAALVAQGGN